VEVLFSRPRDQKAFLCNRRHRHRPLLVGWILSASLRLLQTSDDPWTHLWPGERRGQVSRDSNVRSVVLATGRGGSPLSRKPRQVGCLGAALFKSFRATSYRSWTPVCGNWLL